MAGNGEIEFKIVEHIAVLEQHESGWSRELNVVSWNGGEPKLDIREWSPDHERMTRGITLTEEKAEQLAKVLSDRYAERTKHEKKTPIKDDMER